MLQRCLWLLSGIILLSFHPLRAQTYANLKADFGLRYFPRESRDFQGNNFSKGSINIGYISDPHAVGIDVLFALSMTRHLKSNSKVNGNPLQSEATKVIEFQRNLRLSIRFLQRWGELRVGAWIGRHSVHWLDRDCECFFNEFPKDHKSAKQVLEDLRKKEQFPGIAYHDGLRPALGIHLAQFNASVSVIGPAYRWHNVTLPYHGWLLNLKYTRQNILKGKIESGFRSQFGGLVEFTADGYLRYYPLSGVGFGVHYGRIPYPGYLRPLHRVAVSLKVDLSLHHEW